MRLYIMAVIILYHSCFLYAQDTQLKLYHPFGSIVLNKGALNQELPLIKIKQKGQCWQQSQRIKREDAWRCIAHGKTYDPCFIKPFSTHKHAICPQSPWVGNSVQIDLANPVDNSQHIHLDLSKTYPWAVELITGETCQALDAGRFFDKLPIYYQCNNQTVLIGHLQRCKPLWTILQRQTNSQTVVTASIAVAWF